MTKPLTKAEKDKRKKERREKRKQQKPASPTVRTVVQPKPEKPVNLCDDCVYEYGSCEGTPKFASETDDRVVECQGFRPVDDVPPDQGQAAAPGPAAAPDQEPPADEPPPADQGDQGPQGDEPELIHAQEKEGATEEGKAEDIKRAPIDRFAKDTTDYGPCPSCGAPLKRTAYSRYVDAIRCTKGGCPNYRNIVKTVPSGAK